MDIDEDDLAAFVSARGAPSNEYDVADAFVDRIGDYVDAIDRDAQGNVVATSEGASDDAPEVLLAAHTDELALLVDNVTADGFLEYTKVAGHYKGNFPGQRVVVGPDEVLGVIGAKSRHYMTDEEKETVDEASLTIDVGASSPADVAALNIEPGDFATWDREYDHLSNGRITGRALDDRIALAILVAVARTAETDATVHYAATVQEEVGLRGARMVSHAVDPDVGIAIEIFPADDYPAADEPDPAAALGDGPVVEFGDGTSEYLFGGVLVDRATRTWLKRGASAAGVGVQETVMIGGSTDATELQQVRGGRHAGAIAVPCRYTHSPVETVDLADVTDTVSTLVAALATEFPGPDEIRR
ncbi:MAG: M42 family metallopeptidase [Halolamina sp.]